MLNLYNINMELQTSNAEAFNTSGFIRGRMISWSKSGYREKNPNNEVYFNASIFILSEGPTWFGDLDITKDRPMLQEISTKLGKSLYILRESDTWDKDLLTDSFIVKTASAVIHP